MANKNVKVLTVSLLLLIMIWLDKKEEEYLNGKT
jgi:hypothetical protein